MKVRLSFCIFVERIFIKQEVRVLWLIKLFPIQSKQGQYIYIYIYGKIINNQKLGMSHCRHLTRVFDKRKISVTYLIQQ